MSKSRRCVCRCGGRHRSRGNRDQGPDQKPDLQAEGQGKNDGIGRALCRAARFRRNGPCPDHGRCRDEDAGRRPDEGLEHGGHRLHCDERERPLCDEHGAGRVCRLHRHRQALHREDGPDRDRAERGGETGEHRYRGRGDRLAPGACQRPRPCRHLPRDAEEG